MYRVLEWHERRRDERNRKRKANFSGDSMVDLSKALDRIRGAGTNVRKMSDEELLDRYGTTDRQLVSMRNQKRVMDEEEEKIRLKKHIQERQRKHASKGLFGPIEKDKDRFGKSSMRSRKGKKSKRKSGMMSKASMLHKGFF